MTRRRVYLPVAPTDLAALAEAGRIERGTGYAVTANVRAELEERDAEEQEFEAFSEAATAAGELVAEPTRRVVVSVDVDAAGLREHAEEFARVDGVPAVTARDVAAFHVDEGEQHDDDQLLWFDAAELPAVIALVGPAGG
ncbi:hypothetical protein MM440_11070 [Arsenicicoccus piscis]|uniref:Uncharacterized protein n=1 Tax=Arsenicicoccus piscis TaxID=673954 RepID=A0ABQ6HK70_9MICO|nr:hypothetical protein [Arsenicicoccus piscis]MCH8628301.1 hypothetical protein [Arsenicicoccus piscis]GMA18562.1 hypothetical protein GCM10025862_05830 [Arsenicicoccus piscis]